MGRTEQKIPELVAPAGDMERLKTALHFGADAVYLSGKYFSLRSFSNNFTIPEMIEAVRSVHSRGKRIYLALNSFLRNRDLDPFRAFCDAVCAAGFDALIVSDPAAMEICREKMPDTPLHLSTQVNTLNSIAARYWLSQGVQRIILARELSLEEIGQVKNSSGSEIEIFIHGAMCMAYSGRCLLSLYLADREANQGSCTQPCRWKYALVEETRPGMYMPVEQDGQGTYILNSKDLCLLGCLPELIHSGVDAFKIEGRRKGIHYLAGVIKAYRWALDRYRDRPDRYKLPAVSVQELSKLNHREYTTGFLRPSHEETICSKTDSPVSLYLMAGVIKEIDSQGRFRVEVRGRMKTGERLELMGRGFPNPVFSLPVMKTLDHQDCLEAHAGTQVWIEMPVNAEPGDLLRKVPEES